MTLSAKISTKRKALGFTSLNLSSLTGIDQALLSKYENNQRVPSEPHIRLLAEFLQIDYTEMRKLYLAEKIYALLEYETNPMEILQAAENRVEYLSSKSVFELPQLTSKVQEKLKIADELQKTWLDKKPLNQTQLHKMKEYFSIKYTFDSKSKEIL